jgi:hypothetical protein
VRVGKGRAQKETVEREKDDGKTRKNVKLRKRV